MVYLDHNATTPPSPAVRARLGEWVSLWGNPSSIHWAGRGPRNLIRDSRAKIAQALGASPLEIVFTSGGSEANNLAIKGVFATSAPARNRFITSAVEHPSVVQALQSIAALGAEVVVIPVSRNGEISWTDYENALNEKTALVSVMLANNETGAVFPIKKMAKKAHEVGALFHTDAVQALGKIPLQLDHLDADLVSLSGHKFYALKGTGLLYVKRGVEIARQIDGGGQERHRRAGTENLLGIAALGEVSLRLPEVLQRGEQMRAQRDELIARVRAQIPGATLNGFAEKNLPNTVNFSFRGVDGESLLIALDLRGFAVSTGAACSAGNPEPSPALLAMGLSREEAQSSLRVSLGWDSASADLEKFVEELKAVVTRIRQLAQTRARVEELS